MRAAILREYGETPRIGDWEELRAAGGRAVAKVVAAALNPIDLRMASGTVHGRSPDLPYVVGSEGVGLLDGRPVYFSGVQAPFGSLAERCPVHPEDVVELPEGLEPGHALCYGIAGLAAWLALEQRARLREGETVLVLGASGAVGLVAVQAARLLGARRVVAAARSEAGLERARQRGADATVRLTGSVEEMARRFAEAAEGDLHVVLDPLWGAPAAAAAAALAFRGRLVNLGQSAGAETVFASSDVRWRELSILGHANATHRGEERRAALARMFAHAAAGELRADWEELPLDAVADAWRRQGESPNTKLVLVP